MMDSAARSRRYRGANVVAEMEHDDQSAAMASVSFLECGYNSLWQ